MRHPIGRDPSVIRSGGIRPSFARVCFQSLRAILIGSRPDCFHHARSLVTRAMSRAVISIAVRRIHRWPYGRAPMAAHIEDDAVTRWCRRRSARAAATIQIRQRWASRSYAQNASRFGEPVSVGGLVRVLNLDPSTLTRSPRPTTPPPILLAFRASRSRRARDGGSLHYSFASHWTS